MGLCVFLVCFVVLLVFFLFLCLLFFLFFFETGGVRFQSPVSYPVSKWFQCSLISSGFRCGFKAFSQLRLQSLVSEFGFRVDFRIAVLRRWFSLLLNAACKILTFLVYIFGSGCRTRSPPVCNVHVIVHCVALLVLKPSVCTSPKARHTLLVVLLLQPSPSASTQVR